MGQFEAEKSAFLTEPETCYCTDLFFCWLPVRHSHWTLLAWKAGRLMSRKDYHTLQVYPDKKLCSRLVDRV
jgi:hypothetical protein